MNFSKGATILAWFCLPTVALGAICSGPNASPNWYGAVAYPPYYTRETPEKCVQKYELSRCEQSAVMKDGTSNFATDDAGNEVCTPNVNCFPTKQNCNDTLVCSDLVSLKDELANGGHNIVCRHEKTYWQQYAGEVKNCHLNANCMDDDVEATQRQLKPAGWDDANAFATAFREMDIPIGKTYSSPFTRCAEHADLFSDDANEERLELLYMGGWKEVLAVNNITDVVKLNALKWQAYNIRNFAGKKPAEGTNNVMVTHGFNIKLGFGTAVDEGYCMILKPVDTEPSLAESIGNLTVGNQVFEFDGDAFPVDAIARMSPQSAGHMQTCDEVRNDLSNTDDVLALYDSNHDMKITREEFMSAHGDMNNSADAFEFIQSVFLEASTLGKASSSSLELGRFFRLNWGWREFLTSGGNIALPWRTVLENTIGSGGSTSEERVAAFKQANYILSNLIVELNDQDKYPSKAEMEAKLINCGSDHLAMDECFGEVFYSSETTGSSKGDSLFGTPLAYPYEWKPEDGTYESRSSQVAKCLIVCGTLSESEFSDAMGCKVSSAYDSAGLTEGGRYQTANILAWVFGAVSIVCLSGLAFVLFSYIPSKLEEQKQEQQVVA